jgi:hypothetical protein
MSGARQNTPKTALPPLLQASLGLGSALASESEHFVSIDCNNCSHQPSSRTRVRQSKHHLPITIRSVDPMQRYPVKKATLRLALFVFVIPCVALPVRADVAPPEPDPCQGKSVGTACTTGGSKGTCQTATCTRIGYDQWDRDGGGPPIVSYECLACATSTTPAAGASADGGDSPANDKGACSISKSSNAKRVAPWLIATAFSSLFLITRRRRRQPR